jgi:peptidoglycan/LPS O-acetylase OafA/YrhL
MSEIALEPQRGALVGSMVELTVIIPTHNPHAGSLRRTMAGLRAQTLDVSRWETLVVDNASTPPVTLESIVDVAPDNLRVTREPSLGLTAARRRGFVEARGAVCVLVDDDNVLAPDYLETVLRAMDAHPGVAACGGKSIPDFERPPSDWQREFLPLLALRDLGDAPRFARGLDAESQAAHVYPPESPIGAGMAIRREAALAWVHGDSSSSFTDRRGTELSSGGDNDIVFSVLNGGGGVAYFPDLRLTHLIPAERLDSRYLGRLNRGIQRSWMRVLSAHDANPWPAIPSWTVPLRKAKAWFAYRAWQGGSAAVRWQGACGHFEGRARSRAARAREGELAYMPQLDALRAIAVFAVLFSHYAPEIAGAERAGYAGVRLFFVLSGFLITSLLLRARSAYETRAMGRGEALRNFYVRRWLRLFPLLALVLCLAALADVPPVRETFWWHITYTSNIYFALRGAWNGYVSHFWTLAVEEQFYLLWPWVVLFAPRRRLIAVAVVAAAAGPVFRLGASLAGMHEISVMVLPVSCFDTLAAGALLALAGGSLAVEQRRRLEVAGFIVGATLSAAILAAGALGAGKLVSATLLDSALAILFVALVSRAARGFRGRAGALLEWRPIVFLGMISYGIYVYHNFTAVMVPTWARWMHLPDPSWIWGTMPRYPGLSVARHFLGLSLFTCAAAAVSWTLYERPINRLKRHFQYTIRNKS